MTLPPALVAQARRAVREGRAESVSAYVEAALLTSDFDDLRRLDASLRLVRI